MQPPIAGLHYVPEYLDQDTHDQLLASADLHPWQHSVDHAVQVYGYRYHHPTRSVFHIGDLPSWANDLAVRLWREGFLPCVPGQLVANDYLPGTGIFAHVDQAAFGDIVASVSLGSSCVMEFVNSKAERTEELLLEPGSLLVLSGEARWDWTHAIPARAVDTWQNQARPRSRRVSLTYRIVPRSPDAPRNPVPQASSEDA